MPGAGLSEAADTGPFFHNNAIETIEGAVAFYNGDSFNDSPSGQFLANLDPNLLSGGFDSSVASAATVAGVRKLVGRGRSTAGPTL